MQAARLTRRSMNYPPISPCQYFIQHWTQSFQLRIVMFASSLITVWDFLPPSTHHPQPPGRWLGFLCGVVCCCCSLLLLLFSCSCSTFSINHSRKALKNNTQIIKKVNNNNNNKRKDKGWSGRRYVHSKVTLWCLVTRCSVCVCVCVCVCECECVCVCKCVVCE